MSIDNEQQPGNEHRAPCACPIHTPTGYDVQEDRETGHCAACGCSVWNDQDLCQSCDCYGDYAALAAIHDEHLPVYLRPVRCGAAPTRTEPDTTGATP